MKATKLLRVVLSGIAGFVVSGLTAPAQEQTTPSSQPTSVETQLQISLDGAERLAPEQLARYRDLDARAVQQFTNSDLADYLELRDKQLKNDPEHPSVQEEIGRWARRASGQEFRMYSVQFDLAESDCITLVNKTLALSLAPDWRSYSLITDRLRHKDGVIDYRNRNFVTLADWVPENEWMLRDITAELGPPDGHPIRPFTHAIRPKLFVEKPAAPGSKFRRIIFKGTDNHAANAEIRQDVFIPRLWVPKVLGDLATGDVALILRAGGDQHLWCDHLGLIVREPDGRVTIVHSAPPSVRQEDLAAFLDRCRFITGLKFLRVREHARELAAAEVVKMALVQVSTAAQQDQKIARWRAERIAQSGQ